MWRPGKPETSTFCGKTHHVVHAIYGASARRVFTEWCLFYIYAANRTKRCREKNIPCPAENNNNNKELWQRRGKTVDLVLCTYTYTFLSCTKCRPKAADTDVHPAAFDPLLLIIIYNSVPRSTANASRPIYTYIYYYNDVKIMYMMYSIYITRIKYLI